MVGPFGFGRSKLRPYGDMPFVVAQAIAKSYPVGQSSLTVLRDLDLSVDQIVELVARIKRDPDSRRLIVTAWNPAEIDRMALPPCHCLFQFYVAAGADGRKKLSCQLYQRSADVFLGLPFNIASYALLSSMVAHVTGLDVGDFVHTLGDAHLYENHLEQARLQLVRAPRAQPRLTLNPQVNSIFDFRSEDIVIEAYDSHPAIPAPIAV